MRFFKGLLGGHVRLGREHAHAAWSHRAHVQNLAHLRWLAGHPGEGFDPGRCFRHGGGRMLAKLGFDCRAVWVEGAARPAWLEVFQRLDPAGDIGMERAMEARFGNPTQPHDVAIGDLLTAHIEGIHAHLDARIGVMELPGKVGVELNAREALGEASS